MKDKVIEIAENRITNKEHFLVKVLIKGTPQRPKVIILVDGDNGISIDDCAAISRSISRDLEAVIEEPFMLEVSSPGLDYPLGSHRQYKKNIGRKIRVNLTDHSSVKGKLKEVQENAIKIEQEIKKGKKKKSKELIIPFEEINKTKVLTDF